MRQFLLPDLGIGNKDAEIVHWHVAEGDHIDADRPLVSVETEKAAVEIPSPWTGRIVKLLAGEGDLVKVGAPLVEFADGVEAKADTMVGQQNGATHAQSQPVAVSSQVVIRQFALPDLGIGDKDAEVVAWHVAEGDQVQVDGALVSVETEKANVEIPSPWDGRVVRILAGTGELLKVGALLAEFAVSARADPGKEVTPVAKPRDEPGKDRDPSEPIQAPVRSTRSAPASTPAPAQPPSVAPLPAPAHQASSMAQRARDLEADRDYIEATGPGGTLGPAGVDRAAGSVGEPDAGWGEVRELKAEGSHLVIAVGLIAIVVFGLLLMWWLDPLG